MALRPFQLVAVHALAAHAHGHEHEHFSDGSFDHDHDHDHAHGRDHSHDHSHLHGHSHDHHSHGQSLNNVGWQGIAASSHVTSALVSLLLASVAVNAPMLTRMLGFSKGVAAHAGLDHQHLSDHTHDHHHHHHHFLTDVSLVRKTAYGAHVCDLRYCVLEPLRNTTLVVVVGDADSSAQTEESANTGKLRSDLELLEHSLASAESEGPERKAFLKKERTRVHAALKAASASEEAVGSAAELARLQWTIEPVHTSDVVVEPVVLGTGRRVTLSLNDTSCHIWTLTRDPYEDGARRSLDLRR